MAVAGFIELVEFISDLIEFGFLGSQVTPDEPGETLIQFLYDVIGSGKRQALGNLFSHIGQVTACP